MTVKVVIDRTSQRRPALTGRNTFSQKGTIKLVLAVYAGFPVYLYAS